MTTPRVPNPCSTCEHLDREYGLRGVHFRCALTGVGDWCIEIREALDGTDPDVPTPRTPEYGACDNHTPCETTASWWRDNRSRILEDYARELLHREAELRRPTSRTKT